VVEMPNSGARISIPFGWVARLQSGTHNFDLVNVQHPAEQKVTLQDKGFNYSAAISDANRPLTLTNGMQIPQDGSARKLPGQQQGKMFFYSMPYKPGQQLNALSVISKAPSGKAVVFKSAGLNMDKQVLAKNIQTVMQGLSFAGQTQQSHPQMAGMNSALLHGQSAARIKTYTDNQALQDELDGYQSEHSYRQQGKGLMVAGVRMAGRATEDTYAPPSWLRYTQRDPFYVYGNHRLPKYKNRKKEGLYWLPFSLGYHKKASNWSRIELYNLENVDRTRLVTFCREDLKNQYRGTFVIYQRKSFQEAWRKVDTGRYQMFANRSHDYSSGPEGALDTMFLDRKHGGNDIVMVEELKNSASERAYWSEQYAFNGEVYSAHGLNMTCSYKRSKGQITLNGCAKDGGTKECYGKAFPKDFDSSGHSRSASKNSGTSYSSGPNGQSSFGTTSSGKTFFSMPGGGSMCLGCD